MKLKNIEKPFDFNKQPISPAMQLLIVKLATLILLSAFGTQIHSVFKAVQGKEISK